MTLRGSPPTATAPPLAARTGDLPLQPLDAFIASALAVVYFLSLLGTLDIGYTRDEGFYYRFALVYQDWFTTLGDAGDAGDAAAGGDTGPLGRAAVTATWHENFEHPPLMKVLFGWSWRAFGRKERPVTLSPPAAPGTLALAELGRSDGFAVGDAVAFHPACAVDGACAAEPALRGVVTARTPDRAVCQVDAPAPALAVYLDACARADASLVQRPCRGVATGTPAFLSEGTALRLPALVVAAALVALIYVFGTRLGGRAVGLFAAASYAAVPRAFFHAHLACFDVPVTAAILLVLYGFWRSQWHGRWVIGTAVAWGGALLVKHNAFFVPVFILTYWALIHRDRFGLRRAAPVPARGNRAARVAALVASVTVVAVSFGLGGALTGAIALLLVLGLVAPGLVLPPVPRAVLWMPAVGLPMLFLAWPALWYDPLQAFARYLQFHLAHEHYLQYYFGTILALPPFPVSYPFVMTAVTVPVLTLAAFGLGGVVLYRGPIARAFRFLARVSRRDSGRLPADPAPPADVGYGDRVRTYLAVQALLPVLLIAHPATPIFGGVKHWLPAMPFFCIIAGFGFDCARRWVVRGLWAGGGERHPRAAVAVAALLACLWLADGVVATAHVYRFGTGAYNHLVGGLQGAAELRLHRQFWGYATRQSLPRLNREAPRGARIYFQNTTPDAYTLYRRDGLIRPDFVYAWGPAGADLALWEHQKSFAEIEHDIWREFGTCAPAFQVAVDGVPMVSVYANARAGIALAPHPADP